MILVLVLLSGVGFVSAKPNCEEFYSCDEFVENVVLCADFRICSNEVSTNSEREILNYKFIGKIYVYIGGELFKKFNWFAIINENEKTSIQKWTEICMNDNYNLEYSKGTEKFLDNELQFFKKVTKGEC